MNFLYARVVELIAIKAGRIVTPFRIIENGIVVVEGDRIIYVGKESKLTFSPDKVLDFSDKTLIPGLIDIHIHGANGADTMDGRPESFAKMATFLATKGVTAFVPTTVTAPMEDIYKVLEAARDAMKSELKGAKLLGIHMEGPYISRERPGSQDIRFIRAPKLDELEELLSIYGDVILRVTIAPEVEGGLEAIRYLTSVGKIVSLGYTNADYEITMEAFDLGAKIVNHIFNAMRAFHHRSPGIIGAALSRRDVFVEVIPDGIHVHPVVLNLIVKLKTIGRVVIISNSIMATGLPDGKYVLPSGLVIIKDGAARLPSGILVGSTLTMNEAVRRIMKFLSLSLKGALYMATYVPARALGLDKEMGSISVGKKANLAVVDDEMNVYLTMVEGKVVYKKS